MTLSRQPLERFGRSFSTRELPALSYLHGVLMNYLACGQDTSTVYEGHNDAYFTSTSLGVENPRYARVTHHGFITHIRIRVTLTDEKKCIQPGWDIAMKVRGVLMDSASAMRALRSPGVLHPQPKAQPSGWSTARRDW